MKRGGGVHTTPASAGAGWVNQADGQVLSRHRLKRSAVAAGRAAARVREVEHTIHRADGRIGGKNSYGRDPFPPKDAR